MSRNRFLTGSLATLAVASAFTLAGSPAQADVVDGAVCGQAAVAATYQTVEHPAIFRTVPALTHTEWLWERTVTTIENEYSKVITPASVETDWSRTVVGPSEFLWTRKVIDSPAVPAVPGTLEVGHVDTVVVSPAVTVVEDEYVHRITGKLRWESPDWGAQNGNGVGGWEKTGQTRTVETTPAVTTTSYVVDVPATPGTPAIAETSHTDSLWATVSPGADWTGPNDTRPGASSLEKQTTDGDSPAGAGWTLLETRHIAAVTDTLWAATAPEGYAPTGASRVASVHHDVTTATSAAAPAGDGWTQVADSAVTVIDTAETQAEVTAAYTEEVLVTAAIPATAPCTDGTDGGTTGDKPTDGGGGDVAGPTDGTDPGTPTTPTTPDNPDTTTGGIIDDGGPVVEDPNSGGIVSGPEAQAAAAPASASVLPNTGGFAWWMAPTALTSLAAGAALVLAGRRKQTGN